MRIGYYFGDLNPHRDRSLGIPTYARELAGSIKSLENTEICSIVSRSSIAPIESEKVILPWRSDHSLGRLAADHLHPLASRKMDVDLWHYPKGFLPILSKRDVPVVSTVHDTILDYYHRSFPESRPHAAWWYWLGALRRSISKSDLILTISEYSKKQIQNFAEENRLTPPPIVVTYLGSHKELLVDEGSSIPAKENHLIAFASRLPHKGTARMLELWTNWMNGPGCNQGVILKLVGKSPESCLSLINSATNVEILPFQEDESLDQLIRTSRGVIVPSLVEGFGLPVLESYYLSTPVMVVAGTACDEVLADPSLAFDLDDQDSFNEVLERLLNCPPAIIRAKQQELHQRFSWNQVATVTLDAYRTVIT